MALANRKSAAWMAALKRVANAQMAAKGLATVPKAKKPKGRAAPGSKARVSKSALAEGNKIAAIGRANEQRVRRASEARSRGAGKKMAKQWNPKVNVDVTSTARGKRAIARAGIKAIRTGKGASAVVRGATAGGRVKAMDRAVAQFRGIKKLSAAAKD